MSKIKIVSNPYEKKIEYFLFSNDSNNFIPITKESSPNSRLISSDYSTCFFPFKAHEILQEIKKQFYTSDETLNIEFDGISSEYNEIKKIIDSEKLFSGIQLNAGKICEDDDALKKVIQYFEFIKKLTELYDIHDCDIERKMHAFSDDLNSAIPVCIFGNDNVGKSTFINAIIGREILPNTNLSYKIVKSKTPTNSKVKLKYDDIDIFISFENDSYTITPTESENLVVLELKKLLEDCIGFEINRKIYRVLRFLSEFEKNMDKQIFDFIEIETYIYSEVLNKTDNPFVLFNIPTSKFQSDTENFEILKAQLCNFHSCLPIYMTTFSELNSNCDDTFLKAVTSIPQLDTRFTMVIVNKSDMVNLKISEWDNRKIAEIKNYTIVKNICSQGLFFISSLMGLGTRSDGNFEDDKMAEIYSDSVSKYSDEKNKFYKELYKFNIVFSRNDEDLNSRQLGKSDLLLLNSGLSTIEDRIKTFIDNYSTFSQVKYLRCACDCLKMDCKNYLSGFNVQSIETNNSKKLDVSKKTSLLEEKKSIDKGTELSLKEKKQDAVFRNIAIGLGVFLLIILICATY